MTLRPQRTLARPAEVRGFGLFLGHDVVLRALPAPPHHGIVFQRVDLPGQPRVPALIAHVQPRLRRTALACGDAVVETIEHLLAALAGLQIDNCLLQLDAPEPPCGDGSAQIFVAAFLAAGCETQPAPRQALVIHEPLVIRGSGDSLIELAPSDDGRLTITAEINYPRSLPGRQTHTATLSIDLFASEIAPARTFVLDTEVAALRAQGLGRRVTTDNLLVLGPDGPQDNSCRFPDECARHKLLDCLGDLALIGCDVVGRVAARQSGHALNHAAARVLAEPRAFPAPCRAAS